MLYKICVILKNNQINMFRFRFILILLLVFSSTNSLANNKFEKELKKVSKDNGFVDNKGEVYSREQITDKKNTILN